MYKFICIVFLCGHLTLALSAKKTQAQRASEAGLAAITVFVDVTKFTRKDRAASRMTKLHQEFSEYGYSLVSTNIYTENGDLEGFFVSYKK